MVSPLVDISKKFRKFTLHDITKVLDEDVVGDYVPRLALFTNYILAEKQVIVTGPRSSGKCVSGNTLIELSDGTYRPVKELENNTFEVLSYDGTKATFKQAKCVSNGIKPLYLIETYSGDNLEITSNHKVFTKRGWLSIEDGLNPTDAIGSNIKNDTFGNVDPGKDLPKLLGFFIADGSTTQSSLSFCDDDVDCIKEFLKTIVKYNNCVSKKDRYSYHIKSTLKYYNTRKKKTLRKHINPITTILREHELIGKKSTQKYLSKGIMSWNKEGIRLLLKTMFSGDGCIYRKSQYQMSISYGSSSKQLIYQIHRLLIKFGIYNKVRLKHINLKDKQFSSYEISIESKYVELFIKEIGFFGRKNDLCREYLSKTHAHKTLFEQNGLYFTNIRKIEAIGEAETFDLSVPDTTCFFANNLLIHNTWIVDHVTNLVGSNCYIMNKGSDKSGWYQAEEIKKAKYIKILELNKLPKEFMETLKDWGEGKDSEYRVTEKGSGSGFYANKIQLPRKPYVLCLADENESEVPTELRSRLVEIRTDSSIEQNRRILEWQSQKAQNMHFNTNKVDRELLMELKQYIVTLPENSSFEYKHPAAHLFVGAIPPIFTDCRREFPKYIDNTSGIARFYYQDRVTIEKDGKKILLLTPEDMWLNHVIFGHTIIDSSMKCNQIEKLILEMLKEHSVLTMKHIMARLQAKGLSLAVKTVTKHLSNLENIGYVEVEKSTGSDTAYKPSSFMADYVFTIDWNKVIKECEKFVMANYPEVASEYISKHCHNNLEIQHPITGNIIILQEYKESTASSEVASSITSPSLSNGNPAVDSISLVDDEEWKKEFKDGQYVDAEYFEMVYKDQFQKLLDNMDVIKQNGRYLMI